MAFSRKLIPETPIETGDVTALAVGIGMNFATHAKSQPNIEDSLLAISSEALRSEDWRLLSVLVTWLGTHIARVNADRLIRLVELQEDPRVRALWFALARWQRKDRRFARLASKRTRQRLPLLAVGTEFQINRHGEDPRFEGSALIVPANLLRDRPDDVLTPTALAKRHRAYRSRVVMGPSYRADMWAELEAHPNLSAAELARRTYGSFATAWQVVRDRAIAR